MLYTVFFLHDSIAYFLGEPCRKTLTQAIDPTFKYVYFVQDFVSISHTFFHPPKLKRLHWESNGMTRAIAILFTTTLVSF